MAYHLGLEALHEFVLSIEVGDEELFKLSQALRATTLREAGDGSIKSCSVKVDRDGVDVMQTPDEILDRPRVSVEESLDVVQGLRCYVFSLQAYQ